MFDVRPLDKNGSLDFEKIKSIERKTEVAPSDSSKRKVIKNIQRVSVDVMAVQADPRRFFKPRPKVQPILEAEPKIAFEPKWKTGFIQKPAPKAENNPYQPIAEYWAEEMPIIQETENINSYIPPVTSYIPPIRKEEKQRIKKPSLFSKIVSSLKSIKNDDEYEFGIWRPAFSFAKAAVLVFLILFGTAYGYKGLDIKNSATSEGQAAFANLVQAKESIKENNFDKSAFAFSEAYSRFDEISKNVDNLGSIIVEASRFIPYASKLSSGKYLAQSGKDISRIGSLSSEIIKTLNEIKNPFDVSKSSNDQVSFLKIFQDNSNNLKEISALADDLEKNLSKVNVEDIPEDKRETFAKLREDLPQVNEFITGFAGSSEIFADILGGNGPRKYLFLFQNNNEMRATGGFIGTYGVLDIFDGRIRKFYIDGIFNPDGQLSVNIVPPAPIQKISGGWSLHDSNWFPDFPKSAEKAIWFFEKTGGPTVDGVITMTPEVMKKLLEITGPIEMEEYGVTVDDDNFVEKVQNEVEDNYDKELNQPKKILADLAPKILDKIFNAENVSDIAKTMSVLEESLNEKQILLYSANYQIEKNISQRNWSGEILNTQKDYLSVINTNINGYKTDGVIDEKIEHSAEIQPDGSIIDSVTITRKHNGGNSDYDWFNKVNADYMRVYVPLGSKLISAQGQSREFNSPPLDYDSLKFKRDPQVQMEENSVDIDEDTGTKVYEDSGKTVFANWVYVSPQETVVVKYKYLLPFKINLNSTDKFVDTYSLLAQKQSGSRGSAFDSKVIFPENYKVAWKYPDESNVAANKLQFAGNLAKDKFIGIAFRND